MFIVDAHLDLSMNAMEWNRDLRQPLADIRASEQGLADKPDRGNSMVSLPELRKGNIGLVVATQIARAVSPGGPLAGWHSPEQAWAQTQGQLAWYKAMEHEGEMKMITNVRELEAHIQSWTSGKDAVTDHLPIGFLLSLEGADSLITIDHLQIAYNYGLRAVGPAHYGPGRYANGTNSQGGLNSAGRKLLAEMEKLNMILDATHLCDDAFRDAMDIFNGYIWASHNNCRAIVNHNRQFSDDMISILLQKDAVIGVALDAWMIVPGWEPRKSKPAEMNCNLEALTNHIDHICQLAGDTLHAAIGSDLDGGFGSEQSPYDLHSIAGLQQLRASLGKRGYTTQDLENIMHGNWLRFLRKALKP